MSLLIQIIVLFLSSFAIMLITTPIGLPVLRRLKFGQTVRNEGPESHLVKNGTPTMGGLMILFAFAIPCAFIIVNNPMVASAAAITAFFGLVGFMDDFIKVKKKQSEGLKPWQKMGLQVIFTIGILVYMYFFSDISFSMIVPFTHGMEINIGIWALPLCFFVILGTDTGSNFTDGLDGLVSKVTLAILAFLFVVALMQGSTLVLPIAIFAGALLGFLVFNSYPAKVFMGDTGALAIGGFVAVCAIELKVTLFLPIIAFIYVAEVGSVIMQVSYFKMTHGKRIFKMTPIHHHFEKSGWKETKVVSVFTIVTIILCMLAMLAL
ncbi:MAG: phospho-N-acetylmuramoyl-pentapeptide-transferase [Lachnospiraceae bacterium]|nr:phospho-N-acetylmuramoyl-pentapeptide-transferase [Lachnospiraceae bacterium]